MHPALNQQMQAARVLELTTRAARRRTDVVALAPRRRPRVALRRPAGLVRARPAL